MNVENNYNELFDEVIHKCYSAVLAYSNSGTNVSGGANRAITHDVKYMKSIFELSYQNIMENIETRYNKYIELGFNSETSALGALVYQFNPTPMSLMENIELCKNPYAIFIATKIDSSNAYNTVSELPEYLKDIEYISINFKQLFTEFYNRRTEVMYDGLYKAGELFYIFAKSEAEKVTKILYSILNNRTIDRVVEYASLCEGVAIIESYQVLSEAGAFNNGFAAIQQFINAFMNKVSKAATALSIRIGGNTEKTEAWRKKLGNAMNNKVKFADNTDNKDDNNENDDNNTLSLSHYDKSSQLCINLNNVLSNSFKSVPKIYNVNNIDELNRNIDELTKIDMNNINTRKNVLDKLRIKDDPNQQLEVLLINMVSSQAVMDSLKSSNMTNAQLVSYYDRLYNLLGKFETISKRANDYTKRTGQAAEKFSKMFTDAKNKAKTDAQNAQKAEQANNPQQKPTPGQRPKNPDDADVDFSKIDTDKNNNNNQSKANEAVEDNNNSNNNSKPNMKELSQKVTNYLDVINNVTVVEAHLLQAYSTIVYTGIKDIESYFDNYNVNSNASTNDKGNANPDSNNNTNQANNNNDEGKDFNSKDAIGGNTKK